jgi:histidinol dehydrogenase
MIHFYELSTMNATQRIRLLRRAELQIDELTERVRPIIQAVRERGDETLIELTARFDHVQLSPDRLRVGHNEIEQAHRLLDPAVREAIEHAIRNVRTFHERQMPQELWFTEVEPGVMAGEKITPISSVGLYVPRGKGAFPSTMYMLATPASIAGVDRKSVV